MAGVSRGLPPTLLSGQVAWAACVAGIVGVAGLLAACSSPEALQGPGGACMQVTDCQAGLVCIPQKNGPNVCSMDTSSLVATEEAGPPSRVDARAGDGAVGDAASEGGDASVPSEAGPVADTGPAPDASGTPDAPATGADAPPPPDDAADAATE
jgi:hypothetical protein